MFQANQPAQPSFPLAAMLAANPVVVTGMGAVTAAGGSVPALWQGVMNAAPSARWLAALPGFPEPPVAGCAAAAFQLPPATARRARKLDRCVQLALAAAREAWNAAQFAPDFPLPARRGIVVGTSRGPLEKWAESSVRLAQGRMRPTLAASSTLASLSGALSAEFGAGGACLTVSAACASSAGAIGLAALQLVTGQADVMLAGGTEAPLNPLVLSQLRAAGVLGSHQTPGLTCRPFDAHRNGTVLGEGAAFLVLETLASAQKRGVRPLARLAGWAIGSEAGERTGIHETGDALRQVMNEALALAKLSPDQIGYVNTHGTGTRLNDRVEARAVREVLGGVPCSSTKAVTGHCLGAAAAIEAIICLKALEAQLLPPSVNCAEPDPGCPVNLILGPPRAAQFAAALSNSCGFWGNNAALLFARI